MSTTPADVTTFAATVQTVLSSEPPFLGQGVADSSSLGLLVSTVRQPAAATSLTCLMLEDPAP